MILSRTNTIKYKAAISVLAGVLCFLLSPYSITTQIGSTAIKIPFSLLFPIVISLAYGWRYGFVSAIALGAFYPFYIWPADGWANFLTTSLFILFFSGLGYFYSFVKKKSEKSYLGVVLFLVSFFLILFLSYRYLFNPLMGLNKYYWVKNSLNGFDTSLLSMFALKDCINISILTIFSDLILQLQPIRKILRIPVESKMRVNLGIFFSTIIACILIWITYVGLGAALLLHDGLTDGHIQLALFIILAGGFIAARVIIYFFEKQIETKDFLLKSEKSLQQQFELMPVACIIWDNDQKIRSWNPAAEKIFGFSLDEVIGKSANETIVPSNVQKQVVDVWNKLLVLGEEIHSINWNINKNGNTILCEWSNTPLRDQTGVITGIISMVQDITEKKAIENCLEFITFQKWSNDISFFDAITKYLSESLDFEYVFINRVLPKTQIAQSISYYKNGEISSGITYNLKGTPCENVFGKALCIYPEKITEQFPQDLGLVKMGAESYVGQPLWDSSGNPIGLIALISKRKISNTNIVKSILNIVANRVSAEIERAQIEENLRKSEERLSTLFASMTEMVVLHEVVFNEIGEAINYRIIDCNKAYTEITGIKKDDAVGRLATEVYQSDTPPYLHEFTQVGITGESYEYTTYYAPMDKHFMISVVSPRKNTFATITTDITGIKQIQEVISNKNKEMENYLYVASHDLRSPLVNIQGFSQRLKKQTDLIKTQVEQLQLDEELRGTIKSITDEKIPTTLGFINANVSKMDNLINGLLHISRTGRMKLTINKVNLNELFQSVISNFQFQVTEYSISVQIENLPECYGDVNQLNQLFSNLIGNAIKYRDRNRNLKIEIKGQSHYNKVIISIKDNGIGIDSRHIERIWDVFFRVDSSLPETGEGLGLCISKRIVEKHKGKIWVESEIGVGSVFYIELQKNDFTE